jgi:hypothetical protein
MHAVFPSNLTPIPTMKGNAVMAHSSEAEAHEMLEKKSMNPNFRERLDVGSGVRVDGDAAPYMGQKVSAVMVVRDGAVGDLTGDSATGGLNYYWLERVAVVR